MINDVLPASSVRRSPASRQLLVSRRSLVLVIVGIAVYTLVVGGLLLGGVIGATPALLWIALPCLAPAGWYFYGFSRSRPSARDNGLVVSGIGWVLIAFSLFLKFHIEATAIAAADLAAQNGRIFEDASDTTPVLLCFALAVALLAAGGSMSWQAWQEELRSGLGVQS